MAKFVPAYPVPAVTSGSTGSGRGPNCETDVMGHNPPPALQKKIVVAPCARTSRGQCSCDLATPYLY